MDIVILPPLLYQDFILRLIDILTAITVTARSARHVPAPLLTPGAYVYKAVPQKAAIKRLRSAESRSPPSGKNVGLSKNKERILLIM